MFLFARRVYKLRRAEWIVTGYGSSRGRKNDRISDLDVKVASGNLGFYSINILDVSCLVVVYDHRS